jgi:thiamine-monophosphate kinase
VRESELLDHIYRRSSELERFAHVVAGPGHDCAVIALPGGECALLKVDQLVEGIHFAPFPRTPVNLIARKAVARAISDIAAAGGRPLATLVGGVLPRDCGYAEDLLDGLVQWAAHWNAPLVGGDTAIWDFSRSDSSGAEQGTSQVAPAGPLVLSVSVVGVPHGQRGPVLRSGARTGDAVYVSGVLGGTFDARTALGRHLTFEPRLIEARFLCDLLGDDLHAMMDLSDGLGRDGARLAAASGVKLVLESAAIPAAPGARWQGAIAGGEDYELLFTAPATIAIPHQCTDTGVAFQRIGRVEAGAGCVVQAEGREIDCSAMGWEHGEG